MCWIISNLSIQVRVCIDFLEKGTKESSRLDTTQLYKEMAFPSVAQIYKFDAG